MDMEITVKQTDKVTLVTACGFIDGKTAPAFQTKMQEVMGQADKVLLDLSQVSFMSSAGLRVMVITQQQGKNKTVALAALPDNIRDNMDVTGVLHYFQVFDTVEAGLQGLC
jgi:anti-sigma B factor antagonist